MSAVTHMRRPPGRTARLKLKASHLPTPVDSLVWHVGEGFIKPDGESSRAPRGKVSDMGKGGGGGGRSSNDQRSDAMNPNNHEYHDSRDNSSNQGNPNNEAYRSSRERSSERDEDDE